eukprot:1163341-Rhodomonas_salina.1
MQLCGQCRQSVVFEHLGLAATSSPGVPTSVPTFVLPPDGSWSYTMTSRNIRTPEEDWQIVNLNTGNGTTFASYRPVELDVQGKQHYESAFQLRTNPETDHSIWRRSFGSDDHGQGITTARPELGPPPATASSSWDMQSPPAIAPPQP